MEVVNKNIIDSYLSLFERLNYAEKLEMISRMVKSLKKEKKESEIEKKFYATFGAWESELSAEEMIVEINS